MIAPHITIETTVVGQRAGLWERHLEWMRSPVTKGNVIGVFIAWVIVHYGLRWLVP